MKKLLSVLCLFLCAHAASAYTVVLKSGKKVDGTVLREDEATIQIKGDDGITLRLNKNSIDAVATNAANPATAVKSQIQRQPAPQTHQDSKTQESKSDKNRVFTNEDVKDMPEVSILGSPVQRPAVGSDSEKDGKDGRGPNETCWRTSAIRLRKRKAIAQERCGFIRNKPAVATDPKPECPLMQETEKQIEDFRQKARQKGVPLDWISGLDE